MLSSRRKTHRPSRGTPPGGRCSSSDVTSCLLSRRSLVRTVAGAGRSGPAGGGQATVGPCLFVLVTALDRQGQRGGVLGPGLAGLARSEEGFAEAVERLGLARAIAGLAVQGQRLPEMADGLLAAALPQLGNAQPS